jgi:glyoxylase-like metal-dependent hydrolase (beta-lactamase superfamily II)
MYGEPRPVAAEKLVPHPEASVKHLRIIETPGHAPHHLSFEYHDVLFAGEAGGNFFRVGVQEYMRPATPPVFFMEECLRSVDRLLALESQTICYAHFGEHPDPRRKLDAFRKQLIRWKEIIREGVDADPSIPPERLVDRLLERDPDLQAFYSMEPAVQERERFFIANSVRGYLGYLQKAG